MQKKKKIGVGFKIDMQLTLIAVGLKIWFPSCEAVNAIFNFYAVLHFFSFFQIS